MSFEQLKSSYFEECVVYIVDRDMTFGQLKSSYFEECDGVHNSKLWIVEI